MSKGRTWSTDQLDSLKKEELPADQDLTKIGFSLVSSEILKKKRAAAQDLHDSTKQLMNHGFLQEMATAALRRGGVVGARRYATGQWLTVQHEGTWRDAEVASPPKPLPPPRQAPATQPVRPPPTTLRRPPARSAVCRRLPLPCPWSNSRASR